ncbi:MAG: hypothetical protein HW380_1535 [Magnetococcales bacterium]|nr:hypothetical protein [Magnetococcales bacterium]
MVGGVGFVWAVLEGGPCCRPVFFGFLVNLPDGATNECPNGIEFFECA